MSLQRISAPGLLKLTPEQAWKNGTNVRIALKYQPEQTRAAVLSMIKDLVSFVDAKRTLTTLQDFVLTNEAVFEQHPTMKLEELRIVFDDMKMGKHGKFYERLKTAEILEALRTHETQRAELLERLNRAPVTRGLREGQKIDYAGPETMNDLLRKRSRLLPVSERKQSEETNNIDNPE